MTDCSTEPGRVDGRSTRWAGQRERRRAEFVEAALLAIARYGPDTTTEQIAEQAGVARTRLYKHFAGTADLHRNIARRAGELVVAELAPIWNPHGSPADVIATGVVTHLRWLTRHRNLYGYLGRHAVPSTGTDPIRDIAAAIGAHMSELFGAYLTAFGVDTRRAEPVAFGIVGLVESTTRHWLQHPNGVTEAELAERLSRWIWLMLDDTLRAGGITLDPYAPLSPPDSIAAEAAGKH